MTMFQLQRLGLYAIEGDAKEDMNYKQARVLKEVMKYITVMCRVSPAKTEENYETSK
jgi:hypothetical protein